MVGKLSVSGFQYISESLLLLEMNKLLFILSLYMFFMYEVSFIYYYVRLILFTYDIYYNNIQLNKLTFTFNLYYYYYYYYY